MMLNEKVFAQAALLAGQLDEHRMELLKMMTKTAVSGLKARLREDVVLEDVEDAFAAAAGFYALAALNEATDAGSLDEFRAGDLTVRRKTGNTKAAALRQQADQLLLPYLKDRFVFRGV